jgi:hypothetical protein
MFLLARRTESSRLLHVANPKSLHFSCISSCGRPASLIYTSRALAWWAGRILDTVAKSTPKSASSTAKNNQLAPIGGEVPPSPPWGG